MSESKLPFPPSTFPTMSLGPPAGLALESSANEAAPPPPPADAPSVLAAIRACASHDASIRRPAEEALQVWENAPARNFATGYLASLMAIVESTTGTVDESARLLGAILLKNGIPKSFGVPLAEDPAGNELQQERANVRERLPLLLFREPNETTALHLQLSLSNVALFDFPVGWPTLLEDLASVASGRAVDAPTNPMLVRLRAIKTLRLCLQSIRQRKVIVKGARGRGGMLDMRNLGAMVSKAAQERKEMHGRACSIFGSLAEGIIGHCQAAVTSGGGDQAELSLAAGYLKSMAELLPMVEIDNPKSDQRTPAVQLLMESLAQICDAVKAYSDAEPMAKLDKIYRAALTCCIASIRSLPRLFAPQIPRLLPIVVEPILAMEAQALHAMPVKRLMIVTGFVQTVLKCVMYDEKRQNSFAGRKNAVLASLLGGKGGEAEEGTDPNNDPGVVEARKTVTALLAKGTVERLVEALVGKFLRLHPDELEEWEDDPEGRYETDLAERTSLEAISDTPRHCGGALLQTIMARETDLVAQTLLNLAQKVVSQQVPPDDANNLLNREAIYRSLELTHRSLMMGGQRRLNFSEWFEAELRPILQADLAENSSVLMRAMQARVVQVVQAYSTSLRAEESFGVAFQHIARLVEAKDLVTAFCAARCVNHLALLHVRGTEESVQLMAVREHSVLALGNAFKLANRCEGEECLRVTLMCVSALVEANGLALEPVLHAIAEQLPPLWERARDSVPIHSCLLSVLTHLIMKMGYTTVEHPQVQKVLFPLLDYCTDISAVNRAETLLEDGLRLWLVVAISSRVETMGQSLASMLPRLQNIVQSKLEPHLSLKVLQYNAILLGPEVAEPLAPVLRDLLIDLTTCIHAEKKEGGEDAIENSDDARLEGRDRSTTTTRYAVAALTFADGLMKLFPELGLSICSPALSKVVKALPGKAVAAPLVEATFGAFGRMLWINPNSLDEIFADDPNQDEKIAVIARSYIQVVSSVSVVVMLSAQAQKVTFIEQKGAALSLCSAVCRSPRVARVAGNEVTMFTRKLLEVESRSQLDLDALVEAACGTTRKVVGDGPMGDSAARTAAILKADPLLTVSLHEALQNAEKAMAGLA
ncbi:hypothetical protein ACHAXT_011407 [Thalassiosira profunda]